MRVALLVNFIPPYRLPLYEKLSQEVDTLRVFVSTKMEPDRNWQVEWGKLDVVVQKTITFNLKSRHPHGFQDQSFVHLPISTFFDLNNFKPKIIISGEMGIRTLGSVLYTWIHPDCKLIEWATISEHTEKNRGALRHFLRKLILKNADAVMVNGASGKRYIQTYGITSERIFRVPYTTDIKPFLACTKIRNDSHIKKILYVGQLIERKGILGFLENFIQWMSNHPDENAEFTICGEGPLKGTILHLTIPSNLNLILTGFIPYHEIPNIFSKVDTFVFPTLADEWGLVVNEAMASGLPVLGSLYSQSVEELVEDNATGWTFFPDNPKSVENAITRMMSTSPEQRMEFGQRGREKVLRFDITHVTDNIMAALNFVQDSSI